MALGPYSFKIETGCNLMIIGPSNSGKSFLCCKIVLERDKLFQTPPDRVIYFFQDHQAIFDDIKEQDNSVIFVNTIEDFENELQSEEQFSNTLVIFDDFLIKSLYEEVKYIINFFLRRSHHLNVSTIFQSQLLFPRNLKSLALNSSYFILLKSNNQQQVHHWLRQIDPYCWKAVLAAYNDCTENTEFGHFLSIFILAHQSC